MPHHNYNQILIQNHNQNQRCGDLCKVVSLIDISWKYSSAASAVHMQVVRMCMVCTCATNKLQ